ncbi:MULTISPECIES: hypothetical protein [Pseudomonas]|uniref:DUF7673 family protein n=1 Tax=Pseudomonas TaxID=286 RepID=UPI00290832BB|nr:MULTISPECIES: hypothetical protein [Pseudomonas]MDU8545721.1 hypothetical protein [Pseudomonas syringae group sp. J248-6]WPP02588.1 hypothetical protein SFA35_26480 [Pseudomonas sp. HR96]
MDDRSEARKVIASEALKQIQAEQEYQELMPTIRYQGKAALERLVKVAQGHSGQSRYIARFLLGCYNGSRFPFDLTDFRCIDRQLFDDCLTVLRMDFQPEKDVHEYVVNGSEVFERLAVDWNVEDIEQLKLMK